MNRHGLQDGSGIRWEYDEDLRILHIDGKGAMGDVIKTIRVETDKTQSGYSEKTIRNAPWEVVSSEAEILDVSPDISTISTTAFMDFKNLREAYLPGVISIGVSAFYMCAKLEAVQMPNVRIIGSSAFECCSSLERLLTNKPYSEDVRAAKPKLALPKVMAVGNFAFRNCRRLTSISMPNCTSVGDYAFMWCNSLTEANLQSATQIGKGAFRQCPDLRRIRIFSGATIGKGALTRSGVSWFEYAVDRGSTDTADSTTNPDVFVFFDIETTGIKTDTAEITEIAAIKVRSDGSISEYFQTFAKPTRKIPSTTIDLNGIDDDMVANAPSQRTSVEMFLEFVDGLPVVGHNIKEFDLRVMANAFCNDLPLAEIIDTLEIARTKSIPGAGDDKQQTIYGSALAYGGIEPTQVQGHAHRALYDADVNRIIFGYLLTLDDKDSHQEAPSKKASIRKHIATGSISKSEVDALKPRLDPASVDRNNPLYGKVVCHTTCADERAMNQLIVDYGGRPGLKALQRMQVLIIGSYGNGLFGGDKTKAYKIALKRKDAGEDVTIITEADLYEKLGIAGS